VSHESVLHFYSHNFLSKLELGRCRFFRSMSVSILFFDFFFKVDAGFGFFSYRDVGAGVDFLTNILLFKANPSV